MNILYDFTSVETGISGQRIRDLNIVQGNGENRSLIHMTFKAYTAIHEVHQAPGNCQAKTGAAEFPGTLSILLVKRIKNRFLFIFRNPDAGVFYLDDQITSFFCLLGVSPHLDFNPTGFSEFDSIANKVQQYLPESNFIQEKSCR